MNTVERYTAAYLGKPCDRPPISAWLGLPWLQQRTGIRGHHFLRNVVRNPYEIIKLQEEVGLDPIVVTVDDRWFSMDCYWRLLYSWPAEALETWRVTREVTDKGEGFTTYRFTATTPEGRLTWGYTVGGFQVGETESAIKNDHDLDLAIKYMPAPETLNQDKLSEMVTNVGDRAFFTHNFIGVWGEAANMRGLVNLSTDIYERPAFVHRLSEFLTDRAVRRARHLAKTGIHSLLYDQSWVGVGYSAQQFKEFMLPYDKQVVKAAKEAGLLVSYHNCGRGMNFLEEMVSTEAHALETLTPKKSSGDFDLAEVHRRVGKHVTLNGGFNERIMIDGAPAQVRDEVKRCYDAVAGDGRYILRTCGQVLEAAPGTLEAFTQAGRELA